MSTENLREPPPHGAHIRMAESLMGPELHGVCPRRGLFCPRAVVGVAPRYYTGVWTGEFQPRGGPQGPEVIRVTGHIKAQQPT